MSYEQATGPTSTWQPPSGSVLLYSGGMDSEIIRYLYKPDLCLYIDNGSPYAKRELEAIATFFRVGHVDRLPWLRVIELHGLEALELPNAIVPGRNALFCIIASNFGDKIYMGVTAGDRIKDKDYQFGFLMSGLLTHMWAPQSWTAGRDRVEVLVPVKGLSKGQLLDKYIKAGGDWQRLWEDSLSCYTPNEDGSPCQICKSCWRKWVAFRSLGLPVETLPSVLDYLLSEVVPLILKGQYGRGPEDADVLYALVNEGRIELTWMDGEIPVVKEL